MDIKKFLSVFLALIFLFSSVISIAYEHGSAENVSEVAIGTVSEYDDASQFNIDVSKLPDAIDHSPAGYRQNVLLIGSSGIGIWDLSNVSEIVISYGSDPVLPIENDNVYITDAAGNILGYAQLSQPGLFWVQGQRVVSIDINTDYIGEVFITKDGEDFIAIDKIWMVLNGGTCGENIRWTLDSEGILTISGTGNMTNYSSLSSVPWYLSSNVKKVIIKNGVTSIGDYAFEYCSSLMSVAIPDSVTSIGERAFYDCFNLKDVYYGGSEAQWNCITVDSNNSNLLRAHMIFAHGGVGEIIRSGKCGDDLTWTLDDYGTFRISGSGSMTNYDSPLYATWDICRSAIEKIIIGDSVTSIGVNAFYNCSNLELLKLGDGLKVIANSAFNACSALESVVIPDSVKSIGSHAFSECTSLKYVKLGSGLKTIGNYVFYECTSLETVSVPESVTYMGSDVFRSCTALKSVTLGNGIKNVADRVFGSCDSLTDIYYTGTEEEWENITIGADNDALWLAEIHFCAHTYGEWTKNDVLSDEDNAIYERKCADCGFSESYSTCNHKTEWVTEDPTTTEKGNKSEVCVKCGEIFAGEELDIIPEKLVIESLPEKLSYSFGETLDLTGLALTYSYADGRENVSLSESDYTVYGFDAYVFGVQTLLIEAGNYKARFDITVDLTVLPDTFTDKIDAGATVESLAELYPDATVYALTDDGKKTAGGDELLKTGMILQIVNSDGTVNGVTVIVNGDITGDGVVNGKDLIRLKKQITQSNAVEHIEYADINSDGVVNENDLTAIMIF